MIKVKHPWMVAIGLFLMGIGLLLMLVPNNAHAQATEAQDVCLARWVWNTGDGGDPFWEPPFMSNHLGTLNLRAASDKGPGPISTGWGLFSYDQPMGSTGMHCLGGDLSAPMTVSQANTLALLLGLEMGQIRARNIRNIIAELYIEEGDPTGEIRWKPLQTSRKGLVIHMGGFGQIYGERFSESSRATQNTLDIRWADYRRFRADGVPVEQLRRQTGWDSWRIFGREPTSADLNRLLPTEYRNDGATCRDPRTCTTITESFNTADSDTLGPDLTWTELGSTDVDIVSNQAHADTAITGNGFARAESDLAGADMYAQANVFNSTDGTSRGNGGCVRYDSSADTTYYVRTNRSAGTFNAYDVIERTAGSDATLTTFSGFSDSPGGVVRLEIIGSDLEVFYAGSSRGTVSDASITGNTRAGICGRHTGEDRLQWDNFEAGDLGAVARRVIRID